MEGRDAGPGEEQEALSLQVPVGLALELSPLAAGGAARARGGFGPVPPAWHTYVEQAVTQLSGFVWDSIVAVGSLALMDNRLGGNSALGRGANN